MKVSTMKYCVNCKFFSPALRDDDSHQYARCAQTASISPVTGKKDRSTMLFCAVARGSQMPQKCGSDAQYFEEATNV